MIETKVNGLAELDQAMATLADKLQRNVVRGALRAGARVIADEAKRLCPVDAPTSVNKARYGTRRGELRDSIRVSTKMQRGAPVVFVKAGNERAYYAQMVEFGTAAHLISVKDPPSRLTRKGWKKVGIATLNRMIKRGTLAIGGKAIGPAVHHPGANKHPFMRPALDAASAKAIEAYAAYIRKRLTKQGLDVPAPADEA